MDRRQDMILFTPGPVQIEAGRYAALRPMHHRTPEFRAVALETGRLLAGLAGSSSAPFLLASSGTGAMEAIVTNCVPPGARVLVVAAGRFGRRWAEIARIYGCRVDLLECGSGREVDAGEVARRVRKGSPALVALTHVESSTGARIDVAQITAGLPVDARPLVAVDAIASLGSEEFDLDRWGIDCAAGVGQKALAAPAGVSFVFASERARAAARANDRPRCYFAFQRYEAGAEAGDSPFTPPVAAVQILHDSLLTLHKAGPEAVLRRHALCSRVLLDAAGALGLKPLPLVPSNSVQAFVLPTGIDCQVFLADVAARGGIVLAGGQDDLKGKIVRAGFPGIHGGDVIELLVRALAAALAAAGVEADLAAALKPLEAVRDLKPLFQTLT